MSFEGLIALNELASANEKYRLENID